MYVCVCPQKKDSFTNLLKAIQDINTHDPPSKESMIIYIYN